MGNLPRFRTLTSTSQLTIATVAQPFAILDLQPRDSLWICEVFGRTCINSFSYLFATLSLTGIVGCLQSLGALIDAYD